MKSAYDSMTELFTPRASSSQHGYIENDYEIRIRFNQTDIFGFHVVYEESGKLLIAAKKANQTPLDWHINFDGLFV